MVWTRGIVARSLGRIVADEHGRSILDKPHIVARDRDMLRRNFIRPGERLLPRFSQENCTMPMERIGGNWGSTRELLGAFAHGLRKFGGSQNQDRNGFGIVLCLRH